MATLTIKNIPDALLRRLKAQATSRRRSLNSEVIACLETFTQAVPLAPEALLARVRAVRRTPNWFRLIDRTSSQLKTEGRP